MNNITASEVAGLGVGALLVACAVAAPKIDSFISTSQRSSLAMCKKCGDLRMIACSKCQGVGMVSDGGPFNFNIMEDLYQSLGGQQKPKTLRCGQCQARGRFSCPDCSNASST
ncbi:hypothetical protein M5689_007408 [Euphorbia peplus]|nr:hypothetical protein M5689_007408 [Euphorbia peplus]